MSDKIETGTKRKKKVTEGEKPPKKSKKVKIVDVAAESKSDEPAETSTIVVPAETSTATTIEEESSVADTAAAEGKKARKSTIARQSESHKHHVIKIKQSFGAALLETCLDVIRYDMNRKEKSENFELEVRLGRYNPSKRAFQSGVSRDYFAQALEAIKTQHIEMELPLLSDRLEEVDVVPSLSRDRWNEQIVEYFSDYNIRRVKTKHEHAPHYEITNRILKKDLIQETHLIYDLRMNIKSEISIDTAESLPFKPDALPNSIRLKTRQSFLFASQGFRIDFTIAWQARTELHLKRMQESADSTALEKHRSYEIEIEILKDRLDTLDSFKIFQSISALLGYEEQSVYPLMPLLEYLPVTSHSKAVAISSETTPIVPSTEAIDHDESI
jgi:hypothetical protein